MHVSVAGVVYAVVYGLAGLGLLGYIGFLCARFFWVERYPDEIHFARCTDGSRIAVLRFLPGQPAAPEPVILCHGIGANRYNLDLTDELSLARYLAAAGYDTWLVELRGRGLSSRPRLFSGRRYDWCFDEYVEQDLPAAAATVQRVTKATHVHWVGFSLGGMALYAHLAGTSGREDVPAIRSAVAIAAPSQFHFQQKYLAGRMIRSFRWMRHRFLFRVLAPLSGYWHPAPLRLIHNPENVDGPILRRMMVNVACNFSRNELLQFSDWLQTDNFRSIDHRRDYRKELGRIDVPLLFLAGARDLLAPPDSVKAAHDAVGSAEKRFLVCSRGQGLKASYGHMDLMLGRDAPAEIFPLVREWIDAHARPAASLPAPEPHAPAAAVGPN